METSNKFEKNLYFNIIFRLNIYIFLLIISNFIVYIVGNYKLFQDSMLVIMLKLNTFLSITEMIIALVSCFFSIFFAFYKKQKSYFFYLIPFFLLAVFSFSTMNIFTIFNYLIDGLAL
ncbi:MAG: hypothetical protein K5839_03315 [Treponemataceae bacterium]|nr:hypothetical protein [Treponemataceae bacterium]